FDMSQILLKGRSAFGNMDKGGAWLSSAHVVRCWVKSRNEVGSSS
ncbi:Ycf68 protein, partial [Trifolium medium]|nr:Ycf68 protein [Trifolium medium]